MYIDNTMVQKQKAAFIVLAIAGLFAFIFGAWQIKYNITAPFVLKKLDFKLGTSSNSLANLQTQDTDKDGLTDYEEIYVYKTSPYIEDSDSDASSDYEEVVAGTDPNCPTGQECSSTATASTAGNSSAALSSSSSVVSSELDQLSNLSASEVRTLLKNAGMDAETLKKMDDKTLMDLYNKALANTQ